MQVLIPLVGPVVANLLIVVILYLFKIPALIRSISNNIESLSANMKTLTASVNQLREAVDHIHLRQSVSDRILSDITNRPIDTEIISKDGSKYPNFRRTKRDS